MSPAQPDPPPGGTAASAEDDAAARVRLLEQVVDLSGESVVVKDLDGVVTFWNREATALYGFEPQEAIGRTLGELHAADLSETEYARVLARIRGGTATTATVERRRKTGEAVRVLIRTTPLFDAGRLVGEVTIARDVTAIGRAEAALREAQSRLEGIVGSAMDAIVTADENGRVQLFNPAAEQLFGYRAADIVGESLARLVPPDLRDAHARHLREFARTGHSARTANALTEVRALRADGSEFLADAAISKSLVGERQYFTAILRDVTGRKRAEASLRESERRLRAVIEQSPVSIAFARDGMTLDVNAVYLRTFGYDRVEELRGRPLLEQIAPAARGDIERRVRARLENGRAGGNYETVGLRRDGSQFPLLVSAERLEFQDGPLTIAFLIDLSRQKKSEEEIRRLAFYDYLTDLPNRRLLQDRLRQAMVASARQQRHGALLYIDLDDFKSLNDSRGHALGDALLQEVGRRLRECVREGDTIARMGGDEFVVVLEGLSGELIEAAHQAESLANKILGVLRPAYRLPALDHHCSASVGATLFLGRATSDLDLVKQADIAMYQAKKAGRNSIRFFDPRMQDAISAQAALEGELYLALQRREFELRYQVQVDRRGRALGAEALIRWMHPQRGEVSPVEFIPLAERTDLILPIGQWVLETACERLAQWSRAPRTRELSLCVNVSARQFRGSGFVEAVRAAVQRPGLDPARLTLELTESLLIRDVEDAIAKMNALREIGVRTSLDDFGTGYSSLQYLKRLPLQQLKIDQSFVRDLASDASDLAIVQTIIAMSRNLGLEVIAEGVETAEQRQLLLDNGCEQFQGFLFGRPVPLADFLAGL